MKTTSYSLSGIINRILMISLIFIGIFMPCLIRVRMQYVLFLAGILYIAYRLINTRVIRLNASILKMIGGFLPFYIYYSILVLSKTLSSSTDASVYITEYRQALSIALYVITIALTLSLYKQKNGVTSERFYFIILIVGVLQMFFVTISFLFPPIKSAFNNLTVRNTFNGAISDFMGKQWYMGWRAYGLAENVFDGFGFVISIIISIVFIYGLSQHRRPIVLLAWIMLIMPLLNARTGLVLCFISFIYIMFKYLSIRQVMGYTILIFGVVFLFPLLYRYLPVGLQTALSGGITDISGLLRGEKVGVFSEILGADLIYPDDLLFGAGASPERLIGVIGIDSGYIQGLWRYGIIGSFLLWGGFAHCFYYTYKHTSNKEDKVVLVSVFMIMIVYNFKLLLFVSYANIFILFFILFVIALDGGTQSYKYMDKRGLLYI